MEEKLTKAQIIRRKLDKLIEQGKTNVVIRFLNQEKNKFFPLRLRLKSRNVRFSTAATACAAGNVDILKAVLKYNNGISTKDFLSCVYISLKLDKTKPLAELLQIKSLNVKKTLNTLKKGKMPAAFEVRSQTAAELLYNAGVNINISLQHYGNPLDWAIENRRAEVSKFYIQKGLKATTAQETYAKLIKPSKRRKRSRYFYITRTNSLIAQKANDFPRQEIINAFEGKSLPERKEIVRMVKRDKFSRFQHLFNKSKTR